jgi:hypothetical protein
MNHVTYQLALSRQDDLSRAAASHRLASQVTPVAVTVPRSPGRHALVKPRVAWLHRLAIRPASAPTSADTRVTR